MAKPFLSDSEIENLPSATDEQIERLEAWAINRIVENDIDEREGLLPDLVLVLALCKRLNDAETSLLSLLYPDKGKWFVGINGDTDVTDQVGAAAKLAAGAM